jgi:hypothetical protein
MRRAVLLLPLAALSVLAGCGGSDERQWMKVDGQYTTTEFRRDYSECSKSGKLDDSCMRSRGWVSVNNPEKPRTNVDARPARRY